MAFDYTKFQRWSAGFDVGGNAMWAYTDTAVAMATIIADGFFDPVNQNNPSAPMRVGDIIWINANDAIQFVLVLDIDPTITVNPFDVVLGAGAVGTANLAAGAVTTAKIAAAAVTSALLDPTTIQYVKVAMTTTQFKAAYATPLVMIAAPGAGKMIVVKQAIYAMTYGTAQYAAGGATQLQYDSTANGLGLAASASVPAATLNGYAATSDVGVAGADTSGLSSAKVNKGLYHSNATGAFTTGDSNFNVHIWYEIVTL